MRFWVRRGGVPSQENVHRRIAHTVNVVDRLDACYLSYLGFEREVPRPFAHLQ